MVYAVWCIQYGVYSMVYIYQLYKMFNNLQRLRKKNFWNGQRNPLPLELYLLLGYLIQFLPIGNTMQ